MGAPRPKLGLPFARPAVAKCTVGERPGGTLGMARWLGSRRRLGAPGSELGLPLAVADDGVTGRFVQNCTLSRSAEERGANIA